MKISDNAIILNLRPYSENARIISCLSENHGIISGFYRSNKKSNNIIPGALVKIDWSARLEEQIGALKIELIHSYNFFLDKSKLISVGCLVSLIRDSFRDRQKIEEIYHMLYRYLDSEFTFRRYFDFELSILQAAGYGLKLDRCGQTGVTENLCYISPKTGCAISAEVGDEFRHKLLKMPDMELLASSKSERQVALDITSYFFQRYIYKNTNRELQIARKFLLD